jgi:hypothetical protein
MNKQVLVGLFGIILAIAAACGDSASNDDPSSFSGPGDGGEGGAGLPERPRNATCKAPARPQPSSNTDIGFVRAFPNMDFDGQAIGVIRSRLGASGPLRWFVDARGVELIEERAAASIA